MAFKSYTLPKPDYWVNVGGNDKQGKSNPESIEGYYLGRTESVSQFDETKTKTTFMLKTSKGVAGVNGSSNLVIRMTDAEKAFRTEEKTSPLGVLVRIQFTGTVPTKKGNPMKKFDVQFDAEQKIEVLGLEDTQEVETVDETEEPDYADYEAPPAPPQVVASKSSLAQVQEMLKRKSK